MMNSKNKQKSKTVYQKRLLKLIWLILPLAICGMLFDILRVGIEGITGLQSGYAELISALIVVPLSIYVYRYAVSKKVEKIYKVPEELKFKPVLFFGGVLISLAVVAIQLIVVSVWRG